MKIKRIILILSLVLLTACSINKKEDNAKENTNTEEKLLVGNDSNTFKIASSSDNIVLNDILKNYGKNIEVDYMGSVALMKEMRNKDTKYDAVWSANSMWITMGNTNRNIKYEKTI